ncbi:hypothetical protein BOTBODRAFT_33557 [Botryobasidium botryosum FD-172 SS1]|uniref:Uncharacterized protein n=1 Tax=Botryobasidium botryosum (strain FD-172 SS1) TaxID=930990 RepID=A0A067MNT1_BOTB1|nr:hypothetical protein BOTBODRAFT_33557 [Botryobasidium botryosum FD-172 SS1]
MAFCTPLSPTCVLWINIVIADFLVLRWWSKGGVNAFEFKYWPGVGPRPARFSPASRACNAAATTTTITKVAQLSSRSRGSFAYT